MKTRVLPLCMALALAGCHREAQAAPVKVPHARPYRTIAVTHPGAIDGTVTLAGPRPPLTPEKRALDVKFCGTEAADSTLVLGPQGTVANAVVTVDVPAGKKRVPTPNAALDQKGCTYAPHVQAVTVGTTLAVLNHDPVLHNVHGYLDDSTVFNKAEPIEDSPGLPQKTVRLNAPGLVHVRCDVHSWMNAWIDVVPNPYFAVTGPDGAFHIGGLPPGTYTLHVWHERLAPTQVQVVVPADGTVRAEVKLSAK